jgi:hypothetical protein
MRRMNTASNKMVVAKAIAISPQCADETATGRRTLFLSSSPQCAEETATGRFSLLSLVANIAQTPLFLTSCGLSVVCFLNILIDYSHEHVAVIKVLQASRRFLWKTRKSDLFSLHGRVRLSGKEPLVLSRAKGKHLFSLSRVNGRLRCFAAAQHDIPELAFINVLCRSACRKKDPRACHSERSEESEVGHAVRLVRPDASLPLSMTRQRAFVMA